MAEPPRRGLGRGLSALLDEAPAAMPAGAPDTGAVQLTPIELIRRNPDQPRRVFDEAEMGDLTESVRAKGVLQPILVRPAPGAPGEYQIVAGERRWRAAQQAGRREVPVLIREMDDLEVLEVAIIENVQRSDLSPLEEANGYKSLMERFGRTQDGVAKVVGKSRSYVANTLRLLALPSEVQDHLAAGRLTAGHARAIATASDPAQLARTIVDKALSVRQAEALARQGGEAKAPAARRPGSGGKDADTRALELDLSESLGLSVEVDDRGGRGEVRIRYESLEQLDELCGKLTR